MAKTVRTGDSSEGPHWRVCIVVGRFLRGFIGAWGLATPSTHSVPSDTTNISDRKKTERRQDKLRYEKMLKYHSDLLLITL